MINRLIDFSLRNRFLILGLTLVVVAAGLYTVRTNPVDAIPDLSETQVIVFADWPGRSPQEVEDQVTYPMTTNLQGLAGVKAVRASSAFGFSMVNVIFEDGTDLYFGWGRTPRPSARSSGTRWKARAETSASCGLCRTFLSATS